MKPPRTKLMVDLMLKENPTVFNTEVRNSDIALTLAIWNRWYGVGLEQTSIIHVHRLFDLTREDNIKRMRAKLQEEYISELKNNPATTAVNILPTDWRVAKQRGIQRDIWEESLGYKEPAYAPAKEGARAMDSQLEQAKLLDVEPKQKRRFIL